MSSPLISIALLVSGMLSLVSFACSIFLAVKILQDEVAGGPLHAIGAFFCGIYALIWGWQHGERLRIQGIVLAYTGIFVLQILASAASAVLQSL